jgi:hypothetical protein
MIQQAPERADRVLRAAAALVVGFAAAAAQFPATRNFEPFTGAAAFTAHAVAIGFGIAVFNVVA